MSHETIVLLPVPDGAEMMMSLPLLMTVCPFPS